MAINPDKVEKVLQILPKVWKFLLGLFRSSKT